MNIGGKANLILEQSNLFKHSIVLAYDNGVPVYLGMPMGMCVEAEGKTIYHTGDTGLFSDMKLIADRHPVDVCFVLLE